MKNKGGIYLHVPFCAAKCAYCDFYSLAGSEAQMDAYTDRMIQELCKTAPNCTEYAIDTIYFGGGTPSRLGGTRLAHILQTVRDCYAVQPDAEITVEANPDSMTEEFLSAVYAAGANRLSMGIQSAHDDELKQLGRIHTFAQAQNAFARARTVGFDNISVDLMYALPQQTKERLAQSIDALLALQPEHLSCYGLTVEPHTPLGRSKPILPDEDTQADMYLLLCDKMRAAGFTHYEISNFCKNGRESRHNSGYWQQKPYLGFGAGAHGDWNGVRYAFPRDLTAWLNGTATAECEDDYIDRAAEAIMLSLRTAQGWDANEYQQKFDKDPAPIAAVLDRLSPQYVITDGTRRHLTEEGFLISNSIILMALEVI